MPENFFDFANAGRGGDIYLGHIVADHVNADKDEALFLQRRADACADFALAVGQFGVGGNAAHMHVGAGIALRAAHG